MTDVSSTAPARIAGKLGARESHEPRLLLSQFHAPLPTAPPEWDGSHGITEWGMDGNDHLGDCGAAATDHGNMAKAGDASLLDQLGRPTFDGTVGTYFAYGIAMGEPGPEPDQGVDNASWLGFLYKNGIIEGYGEVPLDQLDAYAAAFNGVLLAVSLSDSAQSEFENHVAWGQPGDTPDPNLGHDIWLIKYHADQSIEVITWGAIQPCTAQFRSQNITDAWVILDGDDAKRTGVDFAALTAALTEIHGTVEPTVVPAPVPDPTPVPDPAPAPIQPVGILGHLEEEIRKGVSEVLHMIADEIAKVA